MKEVRIKYDGEYPCLCFGQLEVWIGDDYYDFGQCMTPGGSATYDDEDGESVEHAEWSIDYPEGFPEEYKELVLDKVNDEVSWGCCGGCL